MEAGLNLAAGGGFQYGRYSLSGIPDNSWSHSAGSLHLVSAVPLCMGSCRPKGGQGASQLSATVPLLEGRTGAPDGPFKVDEGAGQAVVAELHTERVSSRARLGPLATTTSTL